MVVLLRLFLLLMFWKIVWLSDYDRRHHDDDDNLSTSQSDESTTGRKGYVFRDTRPSEQGFKITWDTNGYIFHCLAMGKLFTHTLTQ